MAKRKIKQSPKASEGKIETQSAAKRFKKQRTSSLQESNGYVSFLSKEKHFDSMDDDDSNSQDHSDATADDSHYENFSSFMKAFSFEADSDNEQKFKGPSQNTSNGWDKSMNDNERRKCIHEVACQSLSSHENNLETDIRILSVESTLSQLVLLQHPASLTLHGYVKVSVLLGSACIFGYRVKEGNSVKVFSTECTGLKKVVTLKSVHKSTVKVIERRLKNMIPYEESDAEEFLDSIGSTTVVLVVKKILAPVPLQFLGLYYPNALQTKWAKNKAIEKERNFKLCSTEESYTIDINDDFRMLSKEVNQIITEEVNQTISHPVSDAENFGPRIIILGEKNMGKSTLIRYLMNSTLNKHPVFYFLDTDLGQTEYTPPGVVSLFRVTKPLLDPPFAHQKKPLKMVFVGSISPATSPELYKTSITCLMKYFNNNFHKETLFVNTMGWCQGVGELCLRSIREIVKPTIVIQLKMSEPNLSLKKEVVEDVHYFEIPSKAPSKESCAPSFSPIESRNFNLVAYLGQCQKPHLPVSLINSVHPVCVSWDKIALYVMGKKVPPHRLVEAMHCSIVALCHVDLSFVLKSDNPDFPMTLYDEPVCECLGFGLVRASDEANRLFFIVTPLTLDQLKNVNALVKGNIMIPDEIILKQTIPNVPLPFTDHSKQAKNPGLKSVPKRAFRNTVTPVKKS